VDIEAIDPISGEKLKYKITADQFSQFEELLKERVTDNVLNGYIDSFNISADAKVLLHSLQSIVITVGEKVVAIGKKLLEVLLVLTRKFPNTAFGIIVAVFLGLLVSAIPLVGVLLAGILKPLLLIFGIAVGAKNDMKDMSLKQAINDAVEIFSPLKGQH